jgi:cysteate synthase
MFDDVLFNRKPPYGIKGGVKEALTETAGEVYGISNQEAKEAQKLFEEAEDIDILPAAAVAVAALQKAVRSGTVEKNDLVLLNITGGGVSRAKEELNMFMLKCDIKAEPSALSSTSSSSSDTDLLAEIFDILERRA